MEPYPGLMQPMLLPHGVGSAASGADVADADAAAAADGDADADESDSDKDADEYIRKYDVPVASRHRRCFLWLAKYTHKSSACFLYSAGSGADTSMRCLLFSLACQKVMTIIDLECVYHKRKY